MKIWYGIRYTIRYVYVCLLSGVSYSCILFPAVIDCLPPVVID